MFQTQRNVRSQVTVRNASNNLGILEIPVVFVTRASQARVNFSQKAALFCVLFEYAQEGVSDESASRDLFHGLLVFLAGARLPKITRLVGAEAEKLHGTRLRFQRIHETALSIIVVIGELLRVVWQGRAVSQTHVVTD